ncbi:hypothetical protein GGR56DRAFT_643765, partial [Xylariaceae sp. FL0804]
TAMAATAVFVKAVACWGASRQVINQPHNLNLPAWVHQLFPFIAALSRSLCCSLPPSSCPSVRPGYGTVLTAPGRQIDRTEVDESPVIPTVRCFSLGWHGVGCVYSLVLAGNGAYSCVCVWLFVRPSVRQSVYASDGSIRPP